MWSGGEPCVALVIAALHPGPVCGASRFGESPTAGGSPPVNSSVLKRKKTLGSWLIWPTYDPAVVAAPWLASGIPAGGAGLTASSSKAWNGDGWHRSRDRVVASTGARQQLRAMWRSPS